MSFIDSEMMLEYERDGYRIEIHKSRRVPVRQDGVEEWRARITVITETHNCSNYRISWVRLRELFKMITKQGEFISLCLSSVPRLYPNDPVPLN